MDVSLKTNKIKKENVSAFRIAAPEELKSTMPTGRSLQMPSDPFTNYSGNLYPLPGGLAYSQLLQCIATNPTLFTSISARAVLMAMGGVEIVKAPGIETANPDNKTRLNAFISTEQLWRAGAGIFGLGSVIEQFTWDHLAFGCGHLEALPGSVASTRSKVKSKNIYDPNNPRIVGVAHLPRLNVRLIRPNTLMNKIAGTSISKVSAEELMYPKLLYSQVEMSSAGTTANTIGYQCYLKSFGDTRIIDLQTGEASDNTPLERQATEFLRWRTYFPGYEEGWAEWVSCLENVNQVDSISRYYTHLFRRNAIPDLIMIVRNAKVSDKYGSEAEEKFRAIRQRREHNDNYTAVAVFDFPAVKNDKTGEVIKVEIELHKLNPLEGPVIQSVLEMEERADRKIAMALRMPAQLINYPTKGGLGGGSELRAVVKMLSQLVIVPDQQKIHGLLDQIVTLGLGIPDWRIRLVPPDYNDPEVEAKIYQAIDGIKSMMVGEKRAFMGYGSLREIMEQAEADSAKQGTGTTFDPDRIFVMGMSDQLVPLSDVELLAGHVTTPDKGGLPEGDEKEKAKEELESLVSGMDAETIATVFDQVVERSRKTIERIGATWKPEMMRSHEELERIEL